jgi:peptidoglycan-associated lipoprotein
MMRTFSILAVVASLSFLSACAHKAAVADQPVAKSTPTATGAAQPAPAPVVAERSCRADDDCGASQLCIRDRCVDITPEVELAECSNVRVHFDYDQWMLHSDDKPKLDRAGRCLRADHKLHITVEGNADERGTEEYNLQLGSKRAVQVEKYLEALGASKDQLKTVSYGYEHPVCSDHAETCWAQNRRAAVKAEATSH